MSDDSYSGETTTPDGTTDPLEEASPIAVAVGARDALVALRTGCHILVATRGVDLSMRQIAILLTVYLANDEATVRGLSHTLEISKPAVSRALDRLGDLGLIRRKIDQTDRRNVLVERTVKGSIFLNDLGEILADAFTSSSRRAA